MNILLPTTITEAMIAEGTNIPSVDSAQGEVLWLPSGEYVIGDLRVYQGSIYYCTKQHTATALSPTPPKDPTQWLFKEPTNRMSPFDEYLYTTGSKLSANFVFFVATERITLDILDDRCRNISSCDLFDTKPWASVDL